MFRALLLMYGALSLIQYPNDSSPKVTLFIHPCDAAHAPNAFSMTSTTRWLVSTLPPTTAASGPGAKIVLCMCVRVCVCVCVRARSSACCPPRPLLQGRAPKLCWSTSQKSALHFYIHIHSDLTVENVNPSGITTPHGLRQSNSHTQ